MTRGATSCAALLALSGASLGVAACGPPPPPKDQVQKDLDAVAGERTADKLFDRGKAFHNVGDLTRAEQYYAAALKAGAPSGKVLPHLMRACVDSHRYRVAIEYAQPYLVQHPGDWRLRLVVATLYGAIGEKEEERVQLERALESNPDDATGQYALATLLRDEYKDLPGADVHFREYLRLDPAGAHAEEARGGLLKSVP